MVGHPFGVGFVRGVRSDEKVDASLLSYKYKQAGRTAQVSTTQHGTAQHTNTVQQHSRHMPSCGCTAHNSK